MKYLLLLIVIHLLFACSKVRESAGVTRQSLDEFQVIENPPLIIPPDFNLLPPEQLEKKNIQNVEKELAKEILFGIENDTDNQNLENFSTMNQIINNTEANNVNSNIRQEIDEYFANEVKTDGIFKNNWENEVEVLDAVKESERIREQKSKGESLAEGNVQTTTKKTKPKKKKRFFFF